MFWVRVRTDDTRWFIPANALSGGQLSGSETGWATGHVFATPLQVDANMEVQGIGIRKNNTTQTSQTWRVGIYESVDAIPGDLLAEFGQIDLRVGSGGIISVAGTADLTRNVLYYVVGKIDDLTGSSAGATWRQGNAATWTDNPYITPPWGFDSADLTAGTYQQGWLHSTGHGTGALPSDLSGATWDGSVSGATAIGPPALWITGVLEGDPVEAGYDHWGWAEGADAMDSWQAA